jgi:galactokinase/mevalonate kinase-like predicted kinase
MTEQEIVVNDNYKNTIFRGGIDMEPFFREYGGVMLLTTFDKCSHILGRKIS